jgi:hypothetical protein
VGSPESLDRSYHVLELPEPAVVQSARRRGIDPEVNFEPSSEFMVGVRDDKCGGWIYCGVEDFNGLLGLALIVVVVLVGPVVVVLVAIVVALSPLVVSVVLSPAVVSLAVAECNSAYL